jgi:hypothetical protein
VWHLRKDHSFFTGKGKVLAFCPLLFVMIAFRFFLRYETGDRQWNQLNVSAALKMPMNRLVLRG